MQCPKCCSQVASFWRWSLWPGPTRHCLHCGAKLRYVGFYSQLAAHAVLFGIITGGVFTFGIMQGVPLWFCVLLTSLMLAGLGSLTAFWLPWRFGRYKEIDPAQSVVTPR